MASSDGSKVYVAGVSGDVHVINTTNDSVIASISVDHGYLGIWGIAISPDGSKVYVTHDDDGSISVINTYSNTIVASIPIGSTLKSIVVSPDGRAVYVANYSSNTVNVINTSTNKVINTIWVGVNPSGLAISPDGSKLYVTNYLDNTVSVINTSNYNTVSTINVGANPTGISVSPDGNSVYVANKGYNCVFVINASSNSVVDTIITGIHPVAYGNFITNVVTPCIGINYNNIAGEIVTATGKNINNVTFNIKDSVINYGINNSDSLGKYNLTFNTSNVIIQPTKNNDINKTNGVTTLDIAYTQSHILGKNKLNSPFKLIAADVNGDGKVSTLDIVYMKRLILGIDTTFTNSTIKENRLWAFVDSSYQFPDTTNPFPFKDSISYIGLSANKTNQTFIGVKLGDVNYDWNPALARIPSKVFVRPKKIVVIE